MSTAIHESLIADLSADLQEKIARRRAQAKNIPPITINPQRMGGTPLIGIQRIPVVSLIDHLMGGYTVDEFLDSFPGTDRDKVMAILQMIKDKLEEGWMAEEVDY
ncbi:MAG: DUF433 domain-containing protein [Acidobacteriota bacterium]|nr:DUF433 domain-containing protein [Acidobacteriota bacterium]